MKRAIALSLSVLLVALAVAACGSSGAPSGGTAPYDAYQIDPLFRSFYKHNGGSDRFGEVISTLATNADGEKLQYVENGLLVYDPAEGDYFLAPLGVELGLDETPNGEATHPGDLVLDGYRVHPALVDFYFEMGSDLIGAPISNPHYNYARNRMEQHFENVGLYYLLDDADKTPHLLAYGVLACTTCEPYPTIESARLQQPVTDQTFRNFIDSHSIPAEILGDVVEGPLVRVDGPTELIFENMALTSNGSQVIIQPVAQELGYSQPELAARVDSSLLTFVPIQDNLGHNVLTLFHNYIVAHGGYLVSGPPITELFSLGPESGVVRQCFSNLCLDYFTDAIEAQVRPAPLGTDYLVQNLNLYQGLVETGDPSSSTAQRSEGIFTLHVWESYATINSTTPQTISAKVFSHNLPQPGQYLQLYVTRPDNSTQVYNLPATNKEGLTGVTIPPVEGDNGDLVQYKVCLTVQGQSPICINESFMIWGNP